MFGTENQEVKATGNYELKQKLANGLNIRVEEVHTYATPDDVTNIQFWED